MIKSTKKKLKKKQSQRIKTVVLVTGLLICCCIVFSLLFAINGNGKTTFVLESRIKEIKKEKKQDKTENGYETIAWLRVQGTNIDAPIISYDNITALDNVDKADYVWNNINEEKLYNQVAISGHNILNLSAQPLIGRDYFSRFDDLMAFVYEDFVSENKYIQYTVDGEDYIYKVFAVFFDYNYNLDLRHNGDYTEEEMNEYLKYVNNLNVYDFDVEVDSTDKIITLTTCTRMFGQYEKKQIAVVARQLRKDEKMNNYESKAKEKYDEIKKIVEGDGNNEKA